MYNVTLESRSCTYCRRGKAMSMYILTEFVALAIKHARHMRRTLSFATSPALHHFSTLSH